MEEEMLSVERREEQKRCWLEELDRQREEMTERRRREKVLQSQVQRRHGTDQAGLRGQSCPPESGVVVSAGGGPRALGYTF